MAALHCLVVFVGGLALSTTEGLTYSMRPTEGNKICCLPRQWEGVEEVAVGYSAGHKNGLASGRIFLAYDANIEKVAAKAQIWANGRPHEACILQDFKNEKEYIYLRKPRECVIRPLRAFKHQCLTDNFAKHVDTALFGFEENSVVTKEFQVWHPMLPHIIVTVSMMFSGTDEEGVPVCVPAGEVVNGSVGARHGNTTITKHGGSVDFMETADYWNTTQGISDPSVFQIPEFCNSASTPSILSQMSFGTHSMFGY